jgi:hypothetical protein
MENEETRGWFDWMDADEQVIGNACYHPRRNQQDADTEYSDEFEPLDRGY